MKRVGAYIILFFSLFAFIQANTALKPLDLSIPHETTGEASVYYEDVNGDMRFSDIMKLPEDSFRSLEKAVASNGFTNSAFWYRLSVENKTTSSLNKLIVFEPAWLDSVDLMILSPQGKETHYAGGTQLSYHERSIDHYLINFIHTFEQGISTVYVRVKTRDPFIVALSIMDEETYLLEHTNRSVFIGFIFGGITAIMFYNLFLFLGIRKPYHLYYVLTLSMFILMNITYNGYTFMHLLAKYPHIQTWAQSSTIYLFIISLLLFVKEFLNLKVLHPFLSRITIYQVLIVLFMLIAIPFIGGYTYHIFFAIVSVVIATSFIFSISIYSWYKGNKTVKFFVLAALSGVSGALITVLTVISVIPYSFLAYKASDIGMYLDVLFLSLALADRMKEIDKERDIAQKEAKTDSLTGLLNLRSFYEVSSSEYKRLTRNMHPFSVMMIDIDNFKTVNDSYGHAVGDNALRAVAEVLKTSTREYDYAFRRGGDEFLLFLPETTQQMAYTLAERIRIQIENTDIPIENYTILITCSLGIAEYQESDGSLEAVVKRADKALYEAKKVKRNSVQIWNG